MKAKYILMWVCNYTHRQVEYTKEEKQQAIDDFKSLIGRVKCLRLFSIDSDDPDIWYDLGKKVLGSKQES